MFTQSINRMEENITLLDDNENIRVWKGLKEGVRKALDDYNADKHKDQHLGVSALYRIAVIEKLEQLKLNKYIK